MDLGRKFQTTRCGKDDDVRAHFSKLAHPREKLSALGRAISDDEYVAVLIGSLPSCYNSPIDSLTSSCDVNNMDITSTVVIRAAMREYEKRVLRKEKMKLSLPPQKPARRPRRKTLNASIARRRVITSQSAGQRVMGRKVGRRRPGTRTRTRTRMASARQVQGQGRQGQSQCRVARSEAELHNWSTSHMSPVQHNSPNFVFML